MSFHELQEMIGSDSITGMSRRHAIRYVAAAMSAVTAVLYTLIGLHALSVLAANADQTWALAPAAAYALGAVLLLKSDRRAFWVLGTLMQVFVIFMYFSVASQRVPAFEVWGILIRVFQLLLLILLAYLAFRLPVEQSGSQGS